MRFRVEYTVSRGNALENEDYIADEILFLRHQSIDIGDREHDRAHDRGWLIVPTLEQVVWLERYYAKNARYVQLASVALVIEPTDLVSDVVAVGALLKRVRFVWEALELEERSKLFVRFGEGAEQLGEDSAVLVAYALRIEPYLLPAAAGNDWGAASKPYRSALVARGTPEEFTKMVVPASDLPGDAAELRALIETLRHDPRRRVTLRYPDGEYEHAATVAVWLAEATGASVLPEPE